MYILYIYIYIYAFEIQYIVHMGISVQAIILKYTIPTMPISQSGTWREKALEEKHTAPKRGCFGPGISFFNNNICFVCLKSCCYINTIYIFT